MQRNRVVFAAIGAVARALVVGLSGLHSAANAAHEMGGRSTAASGGLGRGATFTLELPIQPPGAAGM